ncbi:MAG TPA: AraC family transcriptional regulator [Burkholderiales bacterium]|nr:AraC family transcriptional regulator [Burkholderiales bacterium]
MDQSNAYGRDFGRNFGLNETPAILARVLKRSEIAVTEVRSNDPAPRHTDPIPREEAWLVAVQMREYPHHEYWEEGRRAEVCDLKAGDTTFYDLRRDPVALIDKPYHAVFFYIPRHTLDAIADDAGTSRISDLEYQPGRGVADRTTLCLGQSMISALEHPERASRLFVDHVTLALGAHISQTYGHLCPVARIAQGGLAPWQVRRAKEILGANLDGGVTLREVAQQCGLSVAHFSRAFRASVGIAPHRWLIRRRIEVAKTLLPDGRLSLPEVAIASGFADQSHFTRVFTSLVGTSPGRWRRDLLAPAGS